MKRAPALAPLIALALVLTAWSLPAAAQWKWRDSSGLIQYSDLPPPKTVPEKDILQRPTVTAARVVPAPAASAPGAASAPAGVDPQLEAKRKQAEQQDAAKRKAEQKADDDKLAAVRTENCQKARANLKLLEDGGRIQRMNDKGEREYLDDAGRAREMAAARQTIASECR